MTSSTLEAIRACSEELLVQARLGVDEEMLGRLVAAREQQIRRLGEEKGGLPTITAAEARELLALDLEVTEALRIRRDELWQELTALRQARTAVTAYRNDSVRPSRYLDRET